jgi:hypothetical protein
MTVLAALSVVTGEELSRAAANQTAGSLRLSAEVADPGSVIKARGRVASKSKRRVVLQRSVRGTWKSVAAGKSGRRGRFELTTRLPKVRATVVRYRVYAPRWTRGPRVLPRRFTPTDSVRTTGTAPTPSPDPSPSPTGTPTLPPPPPTSAPAGLVAGWEMNEPAGSTVMVDGTGHGHHGAISQGAAAAGLHLNGSYYAWSARCRDCPPVALPRVIQVPDSSELEIPDPAVRYSLEVRFSTTSAYGNLMQKGQAGTAGGQIKLEDPIGLRCVFEGANGTVAVVGGTRSLNDGTWHTAACVHTATSVSQWVDGVLVAEVNVSTGPINNGAPFVIGGKTQCDQKSVGCDYYSGLIDWTRISRG